MEAPSRFTGGPPDRCSARPARVQWGPQISAGLGPHPGPGRSYTSRPSPSTPRPQQFSIPSPRP
eukprot:6189682-Pyramimonas_sp.AAC.1